MINKMSFNTPLLKIIKEVCRIKQCSYRLIYTDNKIELKLSPKDSDINETNWMFDNNSYGKIDLKIQLFKHVKDHQ